MSIKVAESAGFCFGVSRAVDTVEKAAQVYMLTAHLPRINTITDPQLMELAEAFGVKYRKDFLNL